MNGATEPVRLAFSAGASSRMAKVRHGDRERCGLLFGVRRGDTWRVARVVELVNEADRADRFALGAAETVRTIRAQGARGLACLGVWHTHPNGSAELSRRDRAGGQEGWCSLVLGAHGAARAWLHRSDGERELALADPSAQAARSQ